jgi:hypothetical protein
VMERLPASSDLAGMLATLASYDRFFGPVHVQTLSVAVLVAERLAESDETEFARQLLSRVVLDATRAGGRAHDIRARALTRLRDLHLKSANVAAAITVQAELVEYWTLRAGPDATESAAARSELEALQMYSEPRARVC